MAADYLLDGLNRPQIDAVTATGGPVVVLAGAGSGKTRVLTRRIAWRILQGQTDPKRVLTLTFTRKAAAELRDRQRQLGLRDAVVAGTFHAVALTQLRERWHEKRTIPPTLIDSKIRFLSQLMGRNSGTDALEVMAEIDWARASLIEPDDYSAAAAAAGRTAPIEASSISELMEQFQREKRRKRIVDFDDLLMLATRDLKADADYAAAVRWRHRHFYVDEFQDVNPLQYQLLEQWLGDRNDLFVVGDPNQAIYGWNGADPRLLRAIASTAESKVVELRDNYRSTKQVLTVASAALASVSTSGSGQLKTKRPSAAVSDSPASSPSEFSFDAPVDSGRGLIAHKPGGPLPSITSYGTDRSEAAGIAQNVLRSHSATAPWSDQAVLVRTNAQLVLVEQALTDARIPARVKSGPGLLGSAEVKAELKVLGRAGVDLVQILEHLDERLANPTESITGIALDRHNNLAALSRLTHEYLTVDPLPNGPGLLAWIDTMESGALAANDDAVELVTFHGAKGLEWPIVHIGGLEDGFVPIVYAKTDGQKAEERRLLYVALTRAERELHLSWAMERTFGTNTMKRSVSPFMDAIELAISRLRPAATPNTNWRRKISEARHQIAKTEPVASEDAVDARTSRDVLQELTEWRKRKARASQVPEHVILPERSLRLIAEHQPMTSAQLASVSGLRASKLQRLGDEILTVLAECYPDDR